MENSEKNIIFFFNCYFKYIFFLKKKIDFRNLFLILEKSKFKNLIGQIFFSFSENFENCDTDNINLILKNLKKDENFYCFKFKYQISLALKKSKIDDLSLINL